jgi:dihydrofolate reductase
MIMRKVVLFIAMSLDGYIATKEDDISFLQIVEKEGEDYGYASFVATIDTVIMGRKTYDKVLTLVPEFPHADKEAYILTRTPRASVGKTHFYTDSLPTLIQKLKAKEGKDIYVDGGAEAVHALLQDDLIDEIRISIIPILLGDGIPLFVGGRPTQSLELIPK